MTVPKQEMAVTSEASDGQSAMEMVILYCVSLQRRGEESIGTEVSPPLKSLEVQFSHRRAAPRDLLPFQKGRSDRTRDVGSPAPSQPPAPRYSLARLLTGVNTDLSVPYV